MSEEKRAATTPSGFLAQLMEGMSSANPGLSPAERRLVDISQSYFRDILMQLRFRNVNEIEPVNAKMIGEAARISLLAAAEVEAQLHQMRDAAAARRKP